MTGQTVAAGFAAAGLKPGEPVGYRPFDVLAANWN